MKSSNELSFTATGAPLAVQRGHFGPPQEDGQGGTIEVNSFFIERNGQPWLPVMGEFQFSRYPRAGWRTELLKIKAGGVTTVASYLFWIHHEEERDVFDWSGQRNLRDFLLFCGEVGLDVVLRIGPFVHGEARNGGLPDWIYGMPLEARSNDPKYLYFVRRYYAQIAAQCHGLLFQDGGPVLGIQLENEFQASAAPWETTHYPDIELTPLGKGGAEHLRALKTIARETGMEVPLWTCTGWGSSVPGEFLPLHGGYAFYAWEDDPTTQAPSPNYVFRDGHKNGDGTDSMTPFGQCEMGSGMQAFYKNRPVVPPESVEAMGCVKLGSAVNLIGYYVYHGGCNPVGRHGFLNEHRCPRISYDFFAPIGDFGQFKPSYHLLRRQNLLIQAFGSRIAPMPTVLPAEQALVEAGNPLPVRAAIRTDGEGGFLFVNNYQDHLDMPEREGVSFRIETTRGMVSLPADGAFRLRRDICAILPFNLEMDGIRLISSTAQPITRIMTAAGPCYAFFAPDGIAPEYAFDASTLKDPKPAGGGSVLVWKPEAGLDSFIELTARNGQTIRIVTLTDAESRQFWSGKAWGAERFIITAAGVCFDNDGISLSQLDSNAFRFSVFPPPAHDLSSRESVLRATGTNTWREYAAEVPTWNDGITTEALGPRRMALRVPQETLNGIQDVFISTEYVGDTGAAYIDGRLVHDNFNNGTQWWIGLRRFAPGILGNGMLLATTPTRESLAKIGHNWSEMNAIQRDETGLKGAIHRVTVHPEYGMTCEAVK